MFPLPALPAPTEGAGVGLGGALVLGLGGETCAYDNTGCRQKKLKNIMISIRIRKDWSDFNTLIKILNTDLAGQIENSPSKDAGFFSLSTYCAAAGMTGKRRGR